MTHQSRYRILSFILPVLAAVLLFSGPSQATEPPDSPELVQGTLPDSVSLDGKVVYVDFWASWCIPCRQSFPWMQELYEKYHDQGLEIVAINVDRERSAAKRFLTVNDVMFPVLFDSTGALPKAYSLEVMPSSFIYDRHGKLVAQHHGFKAEEAEGLAQTLQKLLNEEDSK